MLDADKVLVSINGDDTDETVVGLACNLWRKKKIEIAIVYIIEVKRSLPLDVELEAETQKGEEILHRAERALKEQDCKTETALLQAREAGPAIVQEAVERGADAVVIGLSHRTRFGQYALSDTVDYVLKNAPCHVIVYRSPEKQV
ncbi:MAG: universal stress protein [Dehalococcoidia bacterium]|nr:universal stress protein [Dehalococcoidia bacterium]